MRETVTRAAGIWEINEYRQFNVTQNGNLDGYLGDP